MSNPKFSGTGVALVTPFQNYQIDYNSFATLVHHVTDGGVDFLVVLGSTGEAATISENEQHEVLQFAIQENKGKLPIVAGQFAGMDTKSIVDSIKDYTFEGVDALLIASPAYIKPTQEGIYRHYMAIAEVSPLPIIIYNVPGRTRSNIEWQTTLRLSEASNSFIAIKEASGDLIQTQKLLYNKADNFLLLSGDDELALPFVSMGGDGIISVIANAIPTLFSEMIAAALDGNISEARKLNAQLFPLHHYMYTEGNPAGVKAALKGLGICSDELRLPLCALSTDNYDALLALMKQQSLL